MNNTFLILEGQSRYGALHAMMDAFEAYLKNNTKFNVKKINLCAQDEADELLNVLNQQPGYIFAVQGILFDQQCDDNSYLFSKLKSKVLGWIVDPPVCHAQRIKSMTDSMKIACVDAIETEYIKKYYEKDAYCLHLPGEQMGDIIPIAKRNIDILVPGSVMNTDRYKAESIDTLDQTLQVLIWKSLEVMFSDKHITVEGALNRVLQMIGVNSTDAQMRDYMEMIGIQIDTYYRNKLRELCVIEMLRQGMKVTVCGKGWDEFKAQLPGINPSINVDNVTILSDDMPYAELGKVIADSKIVWNISPFFHEGVHDRVSMAMLNGAVSVTDSSDYIDEHFVNELDAVIYSWSMLELSISRVNELLTQDDELQRIADAGYKKANELFTIDSFARNVFEIMGIVL